MLEGEVITVVELSSTVFFLFALKMSYVLLGWNPTLFVLKILEKSVCRNWANGKLRTE